MKQSILDLIEAEQRLVRCTVATEQDDDLNSLHTWGALLTRHVGLAMPHTSDEHADLDRIERQMVRVAQLAISCLESIQRKKERAKHAGPDADTRDGWKGW